MYRWAAVLRAVACVQFLYLYTDVEALANAIIKTSHAVGQDHLEDLIKSLIDVFNKRLEDKPVEERGGAVPLRLGADEVVYVAVPPPPPIPQLRATSTTPQPPTTSPSPPERAASSNYGTGSDDNDVDLTTDWTQPLGGPTSATGPSPAKRMRVGPADADVTSTSAAPTGRE